MTDLKPINLLIVDDYKADIRLTKEILKDAKLFLNINSVDDGVEAMDYLRKKHPYENTETPDLIILDLNMPRKTGHEVLQEMKEDENLKHIPVIVMTVSKSDEDILKSYNLYANAYIVKPISYNLFIDAVRSIESFWLTVVKLPRINK
jgi:chemotaxis family two-component system response regulator Rcp1